MNGALLNKMQGLSDASAAETAAADALCEAAARMDGEGRTEQAAIMRALARTHRVLALEVAAELAAVREEYGRLRAD